MQSALQRIALGFLPKWPESGRFLDLSGNEMGSGALALP
jgi:hypothetical protein